VSDWSAASFRALKSLIEKPVPAGERRHEALAQIATLEKPPYVKSETSASELDPENETVG
jgi:hypothetical protein